MSIALIERFLAAARSETAQSLKEFCAAVGAAEASVLLPSGHELTFFASTNPLLMSQAALRTPINASFSGAAFRSGQTLAVADAAGKAQHFGAVDAATQEATHEFAAVPIIDGVVVGVLTLVNRAAQHSGPKPFDLNELREAERFARDAAPALRLFAGLNGVDAAQRAGEASLGAALQRLHPSERRVVTALASALIANRGR